MTKLADVTEERIIKNNNIFLFLSLVFFSVGVFATDFGEAQLRSNLGEAFRASVAVQGISPNLMVAGCFRSKIETIEGALLAKPRIGIDDSHADKNLVLIRLSTTEPIAEPAVKLTLELICDGYMMRVYPLLLDYVEMASPVSGIPLEQTQEQPQPVQSKAPVMKPVSIRPETDRAPEASGTRMPSHNAKQARPKSAGNVTSHKDALKISNEEIPTPVAASGTAPAQTPQSQEQQRLSENKSAEETFAKMMRDESNLVSTQDELKKEQQRAQGLETEVLRLKMDLQLKDQKQQTLPVVLIILNVVVILLFVVVVAVLVVMLRKARRAEKQNWSDGSFERRKPRSEQVATRDSLPVPEELPARIESATEAVREPEVSKYLTNLNQDQNLAVAAPEKAKGKGKVAAAPYAFNLFANREGQSIQIEEISDAMQEAEFWLSIKDPQRAIEILEPQSMNANPSTPVMWLLLLDLYRMVENRDKYNQLRIRFKQKFNSNILEYGESPRPDSIKFLCDFDHLTSKLTAFWNTNYILPFLESLLIDDREGERVGFELSVYQDILMLIAMSKELEKPEVKINIETEKS